MILRSRWRSPWPSSWKRTSMLWFITGSNWPCEQKPLSINDKKEEVQRKVCRFLPCVIMISFISSVSPKLYYGTMITINLVETWHGIWLAISVLCVKIHSSEYRSTWTSASAAELLYHCRILILFLHQRKGLLFIVNFSTLYTTKLIRTMSSYKSACRGAEILLFSSISSLPDVQPR